MQCQGPHPVEVGGGTAVAAVRLPDGRTLLASGGTDGTVRLWDPATGAPILTLVIGERVHSLAAVDGGLAVGLESGIVVLDVEREGQPLAFLRASSLIAG
jgi:WD40 repeat protein